MDAFTFAPSILTASAVAMLTYLAGLILYRLFLHPLRNYPGPKVAAATKWYEFYYDILKAPGGTYAQEIYRMHDIYGPIIRINPDEIHVKDSGWLGTLYVNSSEVRLQLNHDGVDVLVAYSYKGQRDKYAPAARMAGTPLSTFGTLDHHTHFRRRMTVSRFFPSRSVQAIEPAIYDRIDKAMSSLLVQIQQKGSANIRCVYLAFATEVISYHFLGKPGTLLDDRKAAEDWLDTVRTVASLTPLIKQYPCLIPAARSFPTFFWDAVYPPLARVIRLFSHMRREAAMSIKEHSTSNHTYVGLSSSSKNNISIENANIFRTILASKLPPHEKEQERIAQEGFLAIVAGGETVSRILTNCTFYILANKEKYLLRLRKELATIMSNEHPRPSGQQLESLPLLTAVVKESLRVTALMTSRLPLVTQTETLRYGLWKLPPGTPISMTYRDVLLDPDVFDDPHEFRPERWLEGEQTEEMTRFYVPFGKGSRMCPGINLAMSELYTMIASVIFHLDLKLYDTSYDRDVKLVRDCFVGETLRESAGVRVTSA